MQAIDVVLTNVSSDRLRGIISRKQVRHEAGKKPEERTLPLAGVAMGQCFRLPTVSGLEFGEFPRCRA